MQPRGRVKPIKVVKTFEPSGLIPIEDIEAKLAVERERRKSRAERFGVEYKEPSAVCVLKAFD